MARQFKVPKAVSHYRLGDLLGSGGVGAVYRATDRRDGTPVAVKLIHPHFTTDDSFPERFEREACAATVLRSPYTVHLFACGKAEGWYFLVMEYVEGRTLRQVLGDGPLPPVKAMNVAAKVGRALSEAEWKEVAHRDLKPDNVLLGAGDSVKVYDFGVARLIGGAGFAFTVGNLPYAAPETSEGAADNRSDIYALGAMLYHMLAGRPPFSGEVGEILRQHHHSPVPLEPLAHLPPSVRALLTRCLEKDPASRPQSASELAGALERVAAQVEAAMPETAELPPVPVEEQPPTPVKEQAPQPPESTLTPQREAAITEVPTAQLSPAEEVTEVPEASLPESSEVTEVLAVESEVTEVLSQQADVTEVLPERAEMTEALPEQTEITEASLTVETAVTEAASPGQPPATALDVPSATQIAQPEATRVGSADTQVAPPSAAITLDLGAPKSARPFGASLGWTSYELSLQNSGDESVELALSAWDSGGRCSFWLTGSVTVPPRAQAVAEVRVRPQVRRRGGRHELRNFTVSAAGAGGPPRVIEGRYEDQPYGWLIGAGAFLLVGVAAAASIAVAALLLLGGGEELTENVTREQLSVMVLPPTALGEEFSQFQLDEERTGLVSHASVAAETPGDVSAADIEALGRLDGYKLEVIEPGFKDSQRRAVPAGVSVLTVNTSVDVFRDEDSAAGWLQYQLAQLPEDERLVRFESFTVERPAGAVGVYAEFEGGGYATILGFPFGRLVGTVAYVSADESDLRARAAEHAMQLEVRMRAVLRGEISETPVPLPTP